MLSAVVADIVSFFIYIILLEYGWLGRLFILFVKVFYILLVVHVVDILA